MRNNPLLLAGILCADFLGAPMPVQLQHAVIHSFNKLVNTQVIDDIVKKDVLLDITLPAVSSLVDGVASLLGKQGNALTYGQFGENNRQGTFPPAFGAYTADVANPMIFLALSYSALDELCDCAAEELLATGGHILVSSYFLNGAAFMLVAMIKQRGGVVLNEDYVPIEITEIDLSKVYQAARININNYVAAQVDELEEDANERTYLAFLGQNKGNAASAYFVKALGCVKGISSSRATSTVIDAIQRYFKEDEQLRPLRSKARDQVVSYLQRKANAGNLASLDDIIHEISGLVQAEHRERVQGLLQYLNDDNRKVPSQFFVDEKTLKRKIRIKGEDAQWAIQFEQNILGEAPDSKISYNRERHTLTINELGDELVGKIETELNSRI
jgi:nucleoid-associated protein